jgi:hypothetical protein
MCVSVELISTDRSLLLLGEWQIYSHILHCYTYANCFRIRQILIRISSPIPSNVDDNEEIKFPPKSTDGKDQKERHLTDASLR